MNCTIRFERNGESRKGARVPANELWLDVGNALEPGCVDHHHIAGYASTLDALVRHPEYLADARCCAENGQEIVVHLHAAPDLDCVGSYYAFLFYLEHGEDEFTGFFGPEGAGNLFVTYINDIDAGRRKVTDYPTLYAVFSALDDGKTRTPQTDLQVVNKGLELLSVALRLLAEKGIDLATCDLSEYLPESFEKECREVSAYSFEEELDTGRVKFETVPLWKKSGTGTITEFVQAAIWKHVPASYNSYNAARRRGAVLTVVPYSIKGENGAEYTRVFISVNPDLDPGNEYTLRPLAEIIEQLEQMEEERLYEQTGSYRRDHSQPRSREGVFSNMPFAATSDPWFIRPDGSLIDSPRSLSLLEYNGILNVIRNNGSAVKTACTVGIAGKEKENTLLGKWEQVPLSVWQEQNRKLLTNAEGHIVFFAELESSLLRQNNRMLEAQCMNLTGRPLYEKHSENVYFADYRTCVYSDLKCTVVLIAAYDGQEMGTLPVSRILGLPAKDFAEAVRGSEFVSNVKRLLCQRQSLLDYGGQIGRTSAVKSRELERLNTEVLALSAEMQKEDMIGDAVEYEQYRFIKKQFGIDELKASVMDELKLLIDESRNRLVSRFNLLSAYAVPFILLTAMFEMGIIRIDSFVDISGPNPVSIQNSMPWVLIGWIIIIGIAAGMFVSFRRKK